MTNEKSCEVVIAGAGLTGRLLAIALANEGLDVLVVDPSPTGGGGGDGRTTAIAYASARLFKRLGVWSPLAEKAGTIQDILVTNGTPKGRFTTGGLSGGALHFPSSLIPNRDEQSEEALGYIVENTAMNAAFEHRLTNLPNVKRAYAVSVSDIADTPGEKRLTLSDGQVIRTKLLVACDGKSSFIRKRLGFRTMSWGYDQKAIIFNIDHSKPHQNVAQELFYPSGPFAILPMAGQRSSIVWTEKTHRADGMMALDEPSFLAEVSNRVGPYLGDITMAAPRAIFPLGFHLVPTPAKGRVILAGDAAHTIHPIAGQGFNLGVKDIAAMADVLGEASRAGLDIGHGTPLEKYARWRRFDTTQLALGTDAINRLFSNSISPIRLARGVGLGAVQAVDRLRIGFMRQAGADLGTLPRLMQPM